MNYTDSYFKKPFGVIGAGSFGKCIANLLAVNNKVLLYVRRGSVLKEMLENRHHNGHDIHPNVEPTQDLEALTKACDVIFPVVPSKNFRDMVKGLSGLLQPSHILIHGTKGLDITLTEEEQANPADLILPRHRVKTMSEVIREESCVLRIGCLSGPNLSKEIARGLPAGTVIASRFEEVIKVGRRAMLHDKFMVFENHDLAGVELAGVLKNILALGSGMVSGLDLGENARALMITRGWWELMGLAELFGSDKNAFLGLAGIGDMIATCSSPLSRNYTVGYRLAKGETLGEIIESMEEVAEGVRTVMMAKGMARYHRIQTPIISAFHAVLFKDMPIQEAVRGLFTERHGPDVGSI